MADQLQLRGGTTSENQSFTGAQREVTVDTDRNTLIVHDGVTPGGFPLVADAEFVDATIYYDDDVDGGSAADAYILSPKGNTVVHNSYADGVEFGFVTENTGTGPATANFAGLGVKNLKYPGGIDPVSGQITGRVRVIYDADNDWLEVQPGVGVAVSRTKVDVRQTVNTGPVNANGRASFITASTGLQATTSGLAASGLVLSFGDGFDENGAVDVVAVLNENMLFSALTDNAVNYLYLVYDEETGDISTGKTTVQPSYSQARPSSPSSGQIWYPVDHRNRAEQWDGASWQPKLLIVVGQATTSSGSVVDVISYAYQGVYFGSDTPSGSGQTVYAHNIGVPSDKISFDSQTLRDSDPSFSIRLTESTITSVSSGSATSRFSFSCNSNLITLNRESTGFVYFNTATPVAQLWSARAVTVSAKRNF